jgi:hypothetical protein
MAADIFKAFYAPLNQSPFSCALMVVALDLYLHPPRRIVLFGDQKDSGLQSLLKVAREGFHPDQVCDPCCSLICCGTCARLAAAHMMRRPYSTDHFVDRHSQSQTILRLFGQYFGVHGSGSFCFSSFVPLSCSFQISFIFKVAGKATAFVCEGFSCLQPCTDVQTLSEQLNPPKTS